MAAESDAPDLRIAVMRLARRLRTERTSDAMTPSQMAVVATLLRSGAMTPGDLADAERVQPPSMTRILHTLLKQDMVTRAPHPTDGRQVVYRATPQAEALFQRDRQRRDQWLSKRLATLTDEELLAVERVIPLLNRLALD